MYKSRTVIFIENKSTYSGTGIYAGRPSILGNPFSIGDDGTRTDVINKFKIYFYQRLESDLAFKKKLLELVDMSATQDLHLICWCAPKQCHTEVIKEFIESELNKRNFGSLFKK